MEKESFLEKATGSLPTVIVTTAAAAYLASDAANPISSLLSPLLPILMNTLPFGRYKKRVEKAIKEIEDTLKLHEDKIRNISDSQYKIINETILSVLQTLDEEKLVYLKKVIQNLINDEDIKSHEAELLSRIVRDISADEIKFLINKCHYSEVIISNESDDSDINILCVSPDSEDAILINGLINMGLLLIQQSGLGGSMNYKFSSIVKKLISLLS